MGNKVHVKKGDLVYVLTGKDSGKKGKVLAVETDKDMILVEGVNMATKHKKPKSRNQQGGRITQELHIHSSNAMLVCNKCDRPTKVAKDILANGEKTRKCKRCGEVIDTISPAAE